MKKFAKILAATAVVVLAAGCTTTGNVASTEPATEGVEVAVVENGQKESEEEVLNANCITNQEPAGDVELLDSFEEGNFWQPENSEYTLDADVSEEWASAGDYSGVWTYSVESSRKGTKIQYYTDALIDTDWTDVKYLVMDVNVQAEKPVTITVDVENAVDNESTTSHKVTAGVGQNTNVIFDFTENKIANEDQISKCTVNILNASGEGTVYIDNVRVIR